MTPREQDRYRRNLAALSAHQPEVSSLVESVAVPSEVARAIGRDGTATFRCPRSDRRSVWFGGSSMPTVSAEAMFGAVVHDAGNAALPGVLSGAEIGVLLGRMPPHGALFVLEDDPVSLKLALHLYDFNDAIRSRRLVFVLGDAVVASMAALFEREPGFDAPTHLFRAPHATPAEIAGLQRQLESGAEAVARIQSRRMESARQAIRGRAPAAVRDAPRVALVSLDATPIAIHHARRIERALAALDWRHEVCVPDTPVRCHTAARLDAIARASADIVLLVNHGAASLRSLLPAEVPVVSWFHDGANVSPAAVGQLAARDRVFATSRTLCDQLLAAGGPADRIDQLDPGADPASFDSPDQPHSEGVAVVMDMPDDSATASGVTLASHVALWSALRAEAAAAAEAYTDDSAGALLERALRACGTSLDEEDVRSLFVSSIRTRIGPAAIGRAAVSALTRAGLEVHVWGVGWSADDLGGAVGCGALAAEASTVASLGAASVVVCPLSWPTSSPVVLDALAAGARVVVREGRRALGDEHPGLSGVERWLSRYRATGDLVAAVRGRAPGSCAGPPRTSAPGARASGDGLSGVQSSNTNRSAAARAAMGEYTLVERIRTIARAVVG